MKAYNLCRLCLKNGSDSNARCDVGRENISEQFLEQLVLKYLPIQVSKSYEPGYTFICSSCISMIQQWDQFCTSCVENDKNYEHRLSEQEPPDDEPVQEEMTILKEEIMLETSYDEPMESTDTIEVEEEVADIDDSVSIVIESEKSCRLCLKEGSDVNSDHDNNDSGTENTSEQSLQQLTLKYLPFKIKQGKDEEYPFICGSCTSRIRQWHQFCTSCIENDKIYQEQHHAPNDKTNNQKDVMISEEDIVLDTSCDEFTTDQCLEKEPVETNKVAKASDGQKQASCDGEIQKPKIDDRRSKPKSTKKKKSVQKQHNSSKKKSILYLDKYLIDEDKYQCPYCPSISNARNRFRIHINVHTRDKIYKCDKCGKEFTRSNSLRTHLTTHSAKPLFKCDLCKRAFFQRTSLAAHKRKHLQKPTLKCPECDYMGYNNSQLKQHSNVHRKKVVRAKSKPPPSSSGGNQSKTSKTTQRTNSTRQKSLRTRKQSTD